MKARVFLKYFVHGCRYLTLADSENYAAAYNRIRYLASLKSSITYIFLTILQKSKLIFMIIYL